MNTALNTSISALNASAGRHQVHANNVANVNTDKFKAGQTIAKETNPAGVKNSYRTNPRSGPLRTEGSGATAETVEGSNVELSEEMPGDMVAERSFQANATMVRTQDEMLGTVIDLLA